MTPRVATAIGETLADLVMRAERAESERDQACEGESVRAQERDEARRAFAACADDRRKLIDQLAALQAEQERLMRERDDAVERAEFHESLRQEQLVIEDSVRQEWNACIDRAVKAESALADALRERDEALKAIDAPAGYVAISKAVDKARDKALDSARAALRMVEWVYDGELAEFYCPKCEQSKGSGHWFGCELKAALGD